MTVEMERLGGRGYSSERGGYGSVSSCSCGCSSTSGSNDSDEGNSEQRRTPGALGRLKRVGGCMNYMEEPEPRAGSWLNSDCPRRWLTRTWQWPLLFIVVFTCMFMFLCVLYVILFMIYINIIQHHAINIHMHCTKPK